MHIFYTIFPLIVVYQETPSFGVALGYLQTDDQLIIYIQKYLCIFHVKKMIMMVYRRQQNDGFCTSADNDVHILVFFVMHCV